MNAHPSVFAYFRKRRERRERAREIVGVLWVWDHAEPMTRAFAEWAELNMLPWGWSIIRDERPRRA